MLQRIVQTCRQLLWKSVSARPSRWLDVTALEERATPATGLPISPIAPPAMYVLGNVPTTPPAADVIATPLVRVDLMPAGGSAKGYAQEWSDMFVDDPTVQAGPRIMRPLPPQDSDTPAPPAGAHAADLALLEAEWIAMQPMNQDV